MWKDVKEVDPVDAVEGVAERRSVEEEGVPEKRFSAW
jgi:hypothetical protein